MPDDARYAQAAVDRIIERGDLAPPALKPATVTAYVLATSEARVRIDGEDTDPTAEPSIAQNITGQLLAKNTRVMVDQRKPHGNYIVGVIGAAPRVGCTLRRTSALAINNAVATDIPFTIEDYDPFDFFPGSGDTITIPDGLDGLYGINAHVDWTGGDLDLLQSLLSISAAGIGYPSRGHHIGNREWSHSVGPIPLEGGDPIIVAVFQSSGNPQNITFAKFDLYRIAD